jgi:hypothetical protein
VEEHLRHCVPCKRHLTEFEAIVTAAQNLAPLSVSGGFCERVIKAVNSRQETLEVLSALRYRLSLAGVAFMVTSAAIFFLIGPPSPEPTMNISTTQDSYKNLPGNTDFYIHPETRISSFPVPERTQGNLLVEEELVPADSSFRTDEFILPTMENVRESVNDKF